MRTGRIVMLVLIAVLLAATAYVALNPEVLDVVRPTVTITDPDTVNKSALAFVGTPFPDDYGLLRVPGWVENQTDQKFRSATLQIQLLDEDGTKKEQITYDVENVEPGVRKTFDINAGTLPPSRTATVSITKIEMMER